MLLLPATRAPPSPIVAHASDPTAVFFFLGPASPLCPLILLGNQYWFGLRKPPCQFLFGVCPCLQLFGNVSYSLYSNNSNNNNNGEAVHEADIDIFPPGKLVPKRSDFLPAARLGGGRIRSVFDWIGFLRKSDF